MERGPRVVRMMSATAWRGDEGGEACPLRRRYRRRARLRRRDVAVLRLLASVALRVLVCRGEVSSAQAARRGGGGTARRLLARTQNHDWLLPSPGAHHGCSEREAMRANRCICGPLLYVDCCAIVRVSEFLSLERGVMPCLEGVGFDWGARG
jgi:hypothetical protein